MPIPNAAFYAGIGTYRGFDPDEPRDEQGRWTDGGGSDGGGDSLASEGEKPTSSGAVTIEQAKAAVSRVASKLEYTGPINVRDDDPPTFELNGQKYNYAGAAYRPAGVMGGSGEKAGHIDIWTKNMSSAELDGLIAHEIEHQKYNKALEASTLEFREILELPIPPSGVRDAVRADGTLNPPYDQQFPNYQDMAKAQHLPDSKSWMIGDGVSGYSMQWWIANDERTASKESAMHETLAEMAAAKLTTGKFPEHTGFSLLRFRKNDDGSFKPKPTEKEQAELTKQWRDLYRAVDRINKRLAKK